uniref:Uncharacterized protein n=1 Tax=Aegilops tauschii subsp. strangulata TaxID=200361 RepID=A0A453HFI0_AEGTS
SMITLLSTLHFQGGSSADTVCYVTFRVRGSRSPMCHTRTSRGRLRRRWRCGSTAARAGRAPVSPCGTSGWATGSGGGRPSRSAGTRMGSRMDRLFRRVAWPTRKCFSTSEMTKRNTVVRTYYCCWIRHAMSWLISCPMPRIQNFKTATLYYL